MAISTQLQQLLRVLLPDKGFKTAGSHRDAIIAGVEESKTYTDKKAAEAVKKTGNETIAGVKTFSDGIVGNVTGNASTVTNGVYTVGNQTIQDTLTLVKSPVVPDATLPQHPVTKKMMSSYSLLDWIGINYASSQKGNVYLFYKLTTTLNFTKAIIDTNHSDGILYFVQYRVSGTNYELINSAEFIDSEANISNFVFQANDYIGTFLKSSTATGGIKIRVGGTGNTVRYFTGKTDLPASITIASEAYIDAIFNISLVYEPAYIAKIEEKIQQNNELYYTKDQINEIYTSPLNGQFKKVGKIRYTNFTNSNFPAPWTNVGFTSTTNGMQSPATGGITQIIEYDQYSNLDSFITSFKFDMISFSNVLLTNYHKKLSTLGGHVVGYDLINSTIKVYSATQKGVMPTTVLAQFQIPFTLVLGATDVQYKRDAMIESYTIINGSNSYTAEYDTRTNATTTGAGYDKFGLVFLSGNIIVKEASYVSQAKAEPDVLILGDSIVNGDTIRSVAGGGHENRWAGLLSQKTSVSIASLGGNTVTDINRDLPFYLSLFKPNKCIYGVGINDSVLSTYTTKANEFIAACEADGIEPILQTLFPRDGREAYCLDVSNWVKNRGVRYIDFRRRMTIDGLGSTRKTELFLGDNLHPNVAGHYEMAQEAIKTIEL